MNITTKPLTFKEVSAIPRNGDHTTSIFICISLEEIGMAESIYSIVDNYRDNDWLTNNLSYKAIAINDDVNIIVEFRFEIQEP